MEFVLVSVGAWSRLPKGLRFAQALLFSALRVGLFPDPWDLGLRWNRKDGTSDGGIRKQAPPLVRILPTWGCDLH